MSWIQIPSPVLFQSENTVIYSDLQEFYYTEFYVKLKYIHTY